MVSGFLSRCGNQAAEDTNTLPEGEINVEDTGAINNGGQPAADAANIDVDQELRDLDASMNAISDENFKADALSNKDLGL